MDVYIKSFNRPFLLDKCLASIEYFGENLDGKIIIMDDGTPQKYLDKISIKYPNVEIKKSNFYIEKSNAISNDLDPEKNIPSVFWKETILNGSEYFVLLEDDCWFTHSIDFFKLEYEMKEMQLQMVKFLWLGNQQLISKNIKDETDSLFITQTKLLTRNALFFDIIYKKKPLKIDVILNRFGIKTEKELLKYYHLYAVASAAFSKKYYEKAWSTSQNKVDEIAQIKEVIQIPKNDLKVAHTKRELIRTSLKTTASKQNKEDLNLNFNIYSLNKILNEAWFIDEFEPFDFQNDLTDDFIKKTILKSDLPSNAFEIWKEWYVQLKQKYINIGCEIINDR